MTKTKTSKPTSVDYSTVRFKDFVQIYNNLQPAKWRIPDIHTDFCDWYESTLDTPKRLVQAFRYSGKSTIFSLAVCWRLMRDPNYTCILMSANQKLATTNAKFIRKTLEKHPMTKHLVPEKDKLKSWQTNTFTVNREANIREASVTVLSIGSNITGNHAEEILADDIEIADNCKTDEAREKLRGALFEMVAISSRHFVWGTPHDKDSIYVDLEYKYGYLTKKWPVFKIDGTPQWPDKYGDDWIAGQKTSTTQGYFNSQYLLIPDSAYNSRFKADSIKWFSEKLERPAVLPHMASHLWIGDHEIKDIQAFWDPALGSAGHDNSVLAVVAKTYDNKVLVTDLITLPPVDPDEGMDPQFSEIIDAMKRNHCNKVTVETNFIKTLPIELRRYVDRRRSARIFVKDLTRTASISKRELISWAIEPLLNMGHFYMAEHIRPNEKFWNEFRAYPNGRHDDHLDAIAQGIRLLLPSYVNGRSTDPLVSNPVRPQVKIEKFNDYVPGQGLAA